MPKAVVGDSFPDTYPIDNQRLSNAAALASWTRSDIVHDAFFVDGVYIIMIGYKIMNEQLIGTKELAKLIRVSTMTVWKYRRKGMPSVRIGIRNYKYDYSECRKWIDEYIGKK